MYTSNVLKTGHSPGLGLRYGREGACLARSAVGLTARACIIPEPTSTGVPSAEQSSSCAAPARPKTNNGNKKSDIFRIQLLALKSIASDLL